MNRNEEEKEESVVEGNPFKNVPSAPQRPRPSRFKAAFINTFKPLDPEADIKVNSPPPLLPYSTTPLHTAKVRSTQLATPKMAPTLPPPPSLQYTITSSNSNAVLNADEEDALNEEFEKEGVRKIQAAAAPTPAARPEPKFATKQAALARYRKQLELYLKRSGRAVNVIPSEAASTSAPALPSSAVLSAMASTPVPALPRSAMASGASTSAPTLPRSTGAGTGAGTGMSNTNHTITSLVAATTGSAAATLEKTVVIKGMDDCLFFLTFKTWRTLLGNFEL